MTACIFPKVLTKHNVADPGCLGNEHKGLLSVYIQLAYLLHNFQIVKNFSTEVHMK